MSNKHQLSNESFDQSLPSLILDSFFKIHINAVVGLISFRYKTSPIESSIVQYDIESSTGLLFVLEERIRFSHSRDLKATQ